MHNSFLRVIALLMALMLTTQASTVHAQSGEPDGTLLSPNMPLPSAFGLQPTFFKSVQAVAPKNIKTTKAAAKPSSQNALNTAKEDGGLSVRKTSATQHRAQSSAKTVTATTVSTPKPTVAIKKTTATKAATTSNVARSTSSRGLATMTVRSTAYNSQRSQTDHTPFITATGARTRFGVVALSRDLLRRIPYGSLLRIEDMGGYGSGRGRGTFNRMLSGTSFIVEDTMHPRKVNTVDVWMSSRRTALQWGKRQIRVTVLRYGRR
jgi:3D (Asp-Asp-Asp) domain-containing protein